MGLGSFFKNLFGTTKTSAEEMANKAEHIAYKTPVKAEEFAEEAQEKLSETIETAREKINSFTLDGSHDAEKPETTTTNNVEEDAD